MKKFEKMPYQSDRTKRFEIETERIILLYHHGKISKRKFEEMMQEHFGETAPYFGEEKED